MTSAEPELARIQRSFQNISDEMANSFEQASILAQMGWYGSFRWDELLKSSRILIISEAGTGKTFECQTEQKRLWSLGEPAFFFELAELARNNIDDLLSHEEETRFRAWLSSQSDCATIFLDSIDELKLTLGSFETALKKLNKALSGQLGRIRVVITTRPIPVDSSLVRKYLPVPEKSESVLFNDESFADIAMNKGCDNENGKKAKGDASDFRIVALMPLSDKQIQEMAGIQGVTDADALLKDIRRRNAEDFARRPQDLIELCVDWRDHKRIRTHKDQVAYNITIKLKPRVDRGEKTQLAEAKAFEGASRLALAALLTRKLTFRHSAKADVDGEPGTALDPASILPDWSDDERGVLLERALFGFASYGRVRFHHRSVVEYLAAHRLEHMLENGMSMKAVKRLLFADTLQGIEIVKPSMRSVVAWLALSQLSVFSELRDREPSILLDHGDPESLTVQQRINVISAYVKRHSQGSWRGLHVPLIQVHRFASIELSEVIIQLWASGIENPEVRELLLELMAAAPIPDGADISYSVVMHEKKDDGERLDALEVLVKLNDSRIEEIILSMETSPDIWPDRLVKSAVLQLFPANISAQRLCLILSRVSEPRDSVSDELGYRLPGSIAETNITPDYLAAMRIGLTNFVVEGVEWQKEKWPHIQTPSEHLVIPLAAVCLRLLKEGDASDDVINSCVVALRFSGKENNEDKPISELRKVLAEMPGPVREVTFWADDAFIQSYHSHENSWSRFVEVNRYGAISVNSGKDRDWILASLLNSKRTVDERAVMLEAALRYILNDKGDQQDVILTLRKCVVDSPILMSRIDDWLKPAPVNQQLARMEKQHKKRKAQEDQLEANNRASWIQFWQEVANNPQTAFSPDCKESTVLDLWKVMRRAGHGSRAEGWNRRFIEQYFSKEVADQLRLTMMDIWRADRPILRSERPDNKKGTYLVKWQLGLAAIMAESENRDWATRLTFEEAKLAVRYAPIELDGFPSWIESLVKVHSGAVEGVLGPELTSELNEIATAQYHTLLLQNISHATSQVAVIFVPRLRAWLDENHQRIRDGEDIGRVAYRLRQVVKILLKYGDTCLCGHIRSIAMQQLSENDAPELARVWLPILMKLDPVEATKQLEKQFNELDPSPSGSGVEWIGLLFDDRHNHETQIDLHDSHFTPVLLLRLLRLAYRYVRPQDDLTHDGVFSLDSRDYAECGRNALLGALLDTKGAEGWAAKIEMSNDPLFAHFRDRALFIAQETAAEEVDGLVRDESYVLALNRFNEAAPTTRDEMFSLLLDRIDDIEDLLLRDDSPRAAWAGIVDEKIMRREIARELRNSANNAYVVDQESVTADEKETDIRLRSVTADLEAVIELKLGDNRSGRDLRDTISEQLVKKYMASDACRSGCLLVTITKTRTWDHPDTNESLDVLGLESVLQEEASKIVREMGSALQISARILDLRPRLPTEKKLLKNNN